MEEEFIKLYSSGLLPEKSQIKMTKANLLNLRQADRIRAREKESRDDNLERPNKGS